MASLNTILSEFLILTPKKPALRATAHKWDIIMFTSVPVIYRFD